MNFVSCNRFACLLVVIVGLIAPGRAHAQRRAFVANLVVAGGPAFGTGKPIREIEPADSYPPARYAVGGDFTFGVEHTNRTMFGLRVGYQERRDIWAGPLEDESADLTSTVSRLQLHFHIKQRFWFRRVSPFVGGSIGFDAMVADASVGAGSVATFVLPSLGASLMFGVEFFVTEKVGIVLRLRDSLTLHAPRTTQVLLRLDGDLESEPELVWDLLIPPVWNSLDVFLGVSLRVG